MSARERRRLVILGVVAIPVGVLVLRSGFRVVGAGPVAATAWAVVIVALWTLGAALLFRLRVSGWFPRRAEQLRIAAVWSTVPASTLGVLGSVLVGLGWPSAAALAIVAAGVGFPFYRRQVDASLLDQVERPCEVRTLPESDVLVATCRAWLADPCRKRARRTIVESNLAYGLVQRAVLADRADGLDEAFELLGALVQHPEIDRRVVRYVAGTLLDAEVVRAERNGDPRGYEAAVTLVEDLARQMPDDRAGWAKAIEGRADLLLYRASRAGIPEADRLVLLEQAERALRDALQMCPPGSELEVSLLARVALTTMSPGGNPEEGTRLARRAVSINRRDWVETGDTAQVTLAALLVHGVDIGTTPDGQVERDLREAERRCREVIGRGTRAAAFAHTVLADIDRVRRRLTRAHDESDRGTGISEVTAHRNSYRELARLSIVDASAEAGRWAAAAVDADDVPEAAEAHLQWVRQLVIEVERRTHPDERDRVVAALQGRGAEAGYWLALAGRSADAVSAIETARAVLLSQRARRLPEQLAIRLTAAGRPELFEQYRGVVNEIGALDRSRYQEDPQPVEGSLTIDGITYAVGAVTRELALWSRHHRLRHDIDTVLGLAGADPAGFAFVQAEAAAGPVVYLVAADDTGYALIVHGAGLPEIRWLPDLTRDEVGQRCALFLDDETHFGRVREQLRPLLGWLWTVAMKEVLDAVPPHSEVVVVAVGALGLLPLHAATDPAGRGEPGSVVCDRVAMRYAPNARMAAAARAAAGDRDRRPGSVLVVAVPAAPGRVEILAAKDEAVAVAHGYGHRATTLFDAAVGDVLERLPDNDVWHLACHGVAVPDQPLESALYLQDGALRLRDILAMRPARHRLAVLSACRSAVPDPARLDEVIGFPAGLLQAGVAGVVSTQWVVADDAAHALTVRFHALLRAGESPARALAAAQSWLRTATNGDLMSVLGDDYRRPEGLPPAALADRGWRSQRPFEHPAFWAAFGMTGA